MKKMIAILLAVLMLSMSAFCALADEAAPEPAAPSDSAPTNNDDDDFWPFEGSRPSGGGGTSSDRPAVTERPVFVFDLSAFEIDPITGFPIDPITGLPFDPETGFLIDPETGLPLEDQEAPLQYWAAAREMYENDEVPQDQVNANPNAGITDELQKPDSSGNVEHPLNDVINNSQIGSVSEPVNAEGEDDDSMIFDVDPDIGQGTGTRTVRIKANIKSGTVVEPGTEVRLTAVPMGYSGVNYKLQWQVGPKGGEFTNIPGAHGLTYEFTYTEENMNDQWRVVIQETE
ncbi:hypothetical protein LJC33_04405 [Eubacteriales bacterium OttesenSCG-928-N13]|nr:hypothetical protein [Eubacteriales bacterium OttesenSCG-928-N13]